MTPDELEERLKIWEFDAQHKDRIYVDPNKMTKENERIIFLITELKASMKREQILKKALEFYASKEKWTPIFVSPSLVQPCDVHIDSGIIARAVLKECGYE